MTAAQEGDLPFHETASALTLAWPVRTKIKEDRGSAWTRKFPLLWPVGLSPVCGAFPSGQFRDGAGEQDPMDPVDTDSRGPLQAIHRRPVLPNVSLVRKTGHNPKSFNWGAGEHAALRVQVCNVAVAQHVRARLVGSYESDGSWRGRPRAVDGSRRNPREAVGPAAPTRGPASKHPRALAEPWLPPTRHRYQKRKVPHLPILPHLPPNHTVPAAASRRTVSSAAAPLLPVDKPLSLVLREMNSVTAQPPAWPQPVTAPHPRG